MTNFYKQEQSVLQSTQSKVVGARIKSEFFAEEGEDKTQEFVSQLKEARSRWTKDKSHFESKMEQKKVPKESHRWIRNYRKSNLTSSFIISTE